MLILLLLATSTATTCKYRDEDRTCRPEACLAKPGATSPEPGDEGVCGPCDKDADCEGGACAEGVCTYECRTAADCGGDSCENGQCVPTFKTIWPNFSLATLSASVNVLDRAGSNGEFDLAAGFNFMGSFTTVKPEWKEDLGTWQALETPRWFFHVGTQLGADGHFALANLGVSFYYPLLGGFFMTYGLGALYERRAEQLFNFENANTSEDRIGPDLRIGIFYNLFFRAAYLFHVHGKLRDHGAMLFTLEYTTDFIRTAVPDQYSQYVIDAVGGKSK